MIGEALGQMSLSNPAPSVCSPQKDQMEKDKDVDLALHSQPDNSVVLKSGKLATPDAKQKVEDTTSSPLESAMSYAADFFLGSTQEVSTLESFVL